MHVSASFKIRHKGPSRCSTTYGEHNLRNVILRIRCRAVAYGLANARKTCPCPDRSHRSLTDLPDKAAPPKADFDDTMEREPKKLRTAAEKGALWHEYDFLVHRFVAHLRRVHPANKDIMMEIIPKYWSRQQIHWRNRKFRFITLTAKHTCTMIFSTTSGICNDSNT